MNVNNIKLSLLVYFIAEVRQIIMNKIGFLNYQGLENSSFILYKYHSTDSDSLVQLKPEQIKTMVLDYIIHLKK
jgi:hypothetical protein